MHLVERFWGAVTSLFAVVSLSPIQDGVDTQHPLPLPSHVASVQAPSVSSSADVIPLSDTQDYPRFTPPGIGFDHKFECKYPDMVGWELCSTETDRKCWLRRKSDGHQYDINTNYEEEAPIGITRKYVLELANGTHDADGMVFSEAKLFNGEYPGPWIEACWGDTLEVKVINKLHHQGTSIHWHGIRQNQTMHMDGVNGITQCPIAKDDYFVYKFNVTQYGSSWYHSHYSVQYADGAVGPLTFHGPSSAEYDEAISPPLIMTDWYHNSAFKVVSGEEKALYPDILLNGLGNVTRYDNNVKPSTVIKDPFQITFEGPQPGRRNKKYLLRVINTSFDTTFKFTIDNHMLVIASADFVPIQPHPKKSILVGIGQRYNVIVEANPLAHNETALLPNDGNYWIRTYISPCFGKKHVKCDAPAGVSCGYERSGILRYNSGSKANPSTEPWHEITLECRDEDAEVLRPMLPWTVKPPANSKDLISKYGELFNVYREKKTNPPYPLAAWTLEAPNAPDYEPMRIDYGNPIFQHLDNNRAWDPEWRVIPEDFTSKDWVYLVIKGGGSNEGTFGAHPIHLHGHDFALLEQAYNKKFDPSTISLNLNNPARRDVVLLPVNGYVIIAFKADNPGAWLVHCHIAFHISEGLGLQIMERREDAAKIWPTGHSAALNETERVCKNWKTWYGNRLNWDKKAQECAKDPKKNPAFCFQDDSGV